MRIYFDICAIQRPLDDPSHLRLRLEAEAMVTLIQLCETGQFDLVASAAHEIENGQNPYPERQAHVSDVLTLARHRVPSSPEVAERTAALVQAGIKQLDAFHLAAAIGCGAGYFCTTDDQLLKRGKALNTGATSVVSPLELILKLDLP